MLPEETVTKPRRRGYLLWWVAGVFAVVFGWGAWRHYDFRQAVEEANERGWLFVYTDPVEVICKDWRAAFRTETWSGWERELLIGTGTVSERDFDLIRRLKPKQLAIDATFPWRDLSQLQGLSDLTELMLNDCPNLADIDALKNMKELSRLFILRSPVLVSIDPLKELKNLTFLNLGACTALTNVDALQDLKALKKLGLFGCTGLKNVDGLHGLTGLEALDLNSCDGITYEAEDALKAALPKTAFRTIFID